MSDTPPSTPPTSTPPSGWQPVRKAFSADNLVAFSLCKLKVIPRSQSVVPEQSATYPSLEPPKQDKHKDAPHSEKESTPNKEKEHHEAPKTEVNKDTTQNKDSAPRKMFIELQSRQVPVTWESNMEERTVKAITETVPFLEWKEGIDMITNTDPSKPDLIVESIHVQGADMFGTRVGFSKFKVIAKKWNEKEQKVATVPGIVFMRGGAVGILCILKDSESGSEYAVTTLQPRVPVGSADFCEIPAGMLDHARHQFAGKAADEMGEETMLHIKEEELFDLTDMAYGNRFRGMYPSAGGCDEFIRLFLYRRLMSPDVIQAVRNIHGGEGESEVIQLKLVPIEDLWKEAPDAKALSALYLYEKYKEIHPDAEPLPVDEEQENALMNKLYAEHDTKSGGKRPKKG